MGSAGTGRARAPTPSLPGQLLRERHGGSSKVGPQEETQSRGRQVSGGAGWRRLLWDEAWIPSKVLMPLGDNPLPAHPTSHQLLGPSRLPAVSPAQQLQGRDKGAVRAVW